jgi:predicted PurR-regulated permease PerM
LEQVSAPASAHHADFAFATCLSCALLLLFLLYSIFTHLVPVVLVSILCAYALSPLIGFLSRKMRRGWAVSGVALALLSALFLVMFFLFPLLVEEVSQSGETLFKSMESLRRMWAEKRGHLPIWLKPSLTPLSLLSAWESQVPALTSLLGNLGMRLAKAAGGVLFVPMLTFILLLGNRQTAQRLLGLVPMRWRGRFVERARDMDRAVSGFIRGQVLLALIMGVLYTSAFALLKLPLALLLGLLAMVGELVPYLGGAIVFLVGSTLVLAQGEPLRVLWLLLVYLGLNTFQGIVLSPWVMGRSTQLGPLAVLLALAAGTQVFGVVGLLLSVPLAVVLRAIGQSALEGYRHSPFYLR